MLPKTLISILIAALIITITPGAPQTPRDTIITTQVSPKIDVNAQNERNHNQELNQKDKASKRGARAPSNMAEAVSRYNILAACQRFMHTVERGMVLVYSETAQSYRCEQNNQLCAARATAE